MYTIYTPFSTYWKQYTYSSHSDIHLSTYWQRIQIFPQIQHIYLHEYIKDITYRIMATLKVETDIIANISASPIFVIMSVKAFRTDVIVFTGDIIMCFTSDWSTNLSIRVTNWPNIFVDQGQFSDPDFISGTNERENVQFADKHIYPIPTYLSACPGQYQYTHIYHLSVADWQ